MCMSWANCWTFYQPWQGACEFGNMGWLDKVWQPIVQLAIRGFWYPNNTSTPGSSRRCPNGRRFALYGCRVGPQAHRYNEIMNKLYIHVPRPLQMSCSYYLCCCFNLLFLCIQRNHIMQLTFHTVLYISIGAFLLLWTITLHCTAQ